MKEVAELIASLLKELDSRRKWIAIALFAILILALMSGFEYFTGHFYYESLEKKVRLLKELQIISNAGIASNSDLYPIYRSAVEELSRPRELRIALPLEYLADPVTIGKAVSGALVWLVILIFGVASERKKGTFAGITVAVAVVLLFIATLFGWIGSILPTVLNPWVNFIGFPLAQFLVLALIFRKPSKPKDQV